MINFFKRMFGRKGLHPTCAGRTDTGKVRSNNEDSFATLAGCRVFVVADGMGGHNAGEVASRATVNIIDKALTPSLLAAMRANPHEARHALLKFFDRANEMVIAMAEEKEEWHGMGCTLVVAFLTDRTLHLCHVGDTRCYLLGNNRLRRLTSDHTTLVEMRRGFSDTSELIAQLQGRHVVTRVIGYPFPEPPEYNNYHLQPGDRILLCTDGLWSMVDETVISEILAAAATPEAAVERLIDLANAAGGEDNITGIAVFC